MSTKINVRSPFYLNLTEPVKPEPLFTCEVANIQQLNIDQQGQISVPNLDFGTVLSITSSDADFANDKFPTESTDTSRVITVRVSIPAGFSNTDDGYLDCSQNVLQPAYVLNTSCSGGATATGSIPSQTLDVGGDSETIDLSSYFTAGSDPIAGYTIYNSRKDLIGASVSGDDITIASNNIGGSSNLQVSAFDNGSNTCTATQTISVTVNAPTVTFDCDDANLTGGSIAQDGTLTKPTSHAEVGQARTISGDTGSNITNYTANNTGSDRSVTLFFDLTVPAGYSNGGSTVECSDTFLQPAGDPEFTCDLANLTRQNISKTGQVDVGTTQLGTIASYSPLSFSEVTTDTARNVTFSITIPSGYSNSGTIDCVKTLTQPAATPTCGSVNYFLSTPKADLSDFCDDVYSVVTPVTSFATSIRTGLGTKVCSRNAPFGGRNFYYAVHTNSSLRVGKATGKFDVWQIDSNGTVQDVVEMDCPADGSANFGIL